jgi:uncharacterized protein
LTFRPTGPDRPPTGRPALRLPTWPRRLVPVVVGLVAVVVVIVVAAGIWTDLLWYRSVHFSSVFGVTYGTRWALFFIAAVFMMAVTGVNTVIAYRVRPAYRPVPPGRPGLEAYRTAIDPHRRLLLALLLGLTGLISGITASAAWRTWLLFVNQVPFHEKDPQFRLDISFFVFTYPFLRLVLSYLFAAVLLSLGFALVVHVLYGGLGWQGRRPRAAGPAQAHLFVLLGVFVLLKAVAYWIDRYGIDFSQRGIVTTGASYTDVNAVLPAKTVLAIIAVLCALLFFAGAIRHSAMLPAVGFGLLVLSAIIVGGVYPAIIQQFVVKPNQLAKESRYIKREIHATREAYGVSPVTGTPYPGVTTMSAGKLASAAAGAPGKRLLDPAVVSQTFQQLQQVKGFYQFPGSLSVDRYSLPGSDTPQDMVVSVRGLSGPPAGQGNWVNTHLVYTHGFGFVAARADSTAADGTPAFIEKDLPPTGELGPFQPRVYFGPQQNGYVIAGGPHPGQPVGEELDYPYQNTGGQKNYTYGGEGGVPVGSMPNRLLYAVKFHELNILLSGAINSDSRILYVRQPLARVAKVAPFLTLDASPYPVVAGGKLLWVVDGYTTTGLYPYSERLGMASTTATSQAPGGTVAGQPTGQVNYIRNSVKAVVNAYTGAVTLYQWGPADPLLRAWMKAFPGVIKPEQDIPSYLRPHLRYPPDLFEMQRQVLAQYHVTDPQAFYGGQNFWSVPNDPAGTHGNTQNQPAYYLTMDMPGYRQPEFSLTTTFVPRNRANLAAFMAVDSNPMQPGYGTIRILQLPQDTTIPGPSQVQNAFETFPRASIELTQLRKGGSQVTLGNLIALPVGSGLLYIEPVYVSASAAGASGSYPTLQRVFVYYYGQPDPVGYGPSLQNALAQVFKGAAPPSPGGRGTGSASAAVRAALKQAEDYYVKAQAALRAGNLGAYQADIAKMKKALDIAQQAAGGGKKGGSTPTLAPSPTATPTTATGGH